jgi:hypothetical protein
VEKRAKVTRLVLEHVERADDAVKNLRDSGVSADGDASKASADTLRPCRR